MFPFTLKQQKNMFCSQLALSVTCTNTPRLSADDCLPDAGMLQPGISYSRAAAHFDFHRDIVQKLQKHYHVSFTACDCLRSHHQRVMSKGRGVYIRGKHMHNRSQTACAISWKIPGLCAISTKTGHNHVRGARHLPLSSLCVGLHAMLQENHHESQLFSVSAIPDEEVTSLHQFYSLLYEMPGCNIPPQVGGSVEHVWGEMECWFRHLHQQPSEANKLATAY